MFQAPSAVGHPQQPVLVQQHALLSMEGSPKPRCIHLADVIQSPAAELTYSIFYLIFNILVVFRQRRRCHTISAIGRRGSSTKADRKREPLREASIDEQLMNGRNGDRVVMHSGINSTCRDLGRLVDPLYMVEFSPHFTSGVLLKL